MADNYVTINGLRLDVDGFCKVRDLTPLLEQGPFRGTDYVALGTAGRTFRTKVRDAHTILLPLLVYGLNDKDGVAHANPYAGLRDNVEQIYTSCVEASDTATVTGTVTYEDGATRSGSVYCPRLDVGLHNGYKATVLAAVLEVVIPSGVLT